MITPGVWKVEPWSPHEAQVVASYGGRRSLICAGVMNDDAALIAAAPEMAKLLRELVDEEGPQPGHHAWASRVHAVLYKIDGEML